MARGAPTRKAPLPVREGGLALGDPGSGVGLAAVVGGVALAGAALAGALAHVCSKRDCQWPKKAAIPSIVSYYVVRA